jgi:cob(I)alamin adenosyltransferase
VTRIYTKTGDSGTTGLIGGTRVPKSAPRLDAYGTVDELNAVLGAVRGHPLPEPVPAIVARVQDELFTLGSRLALPAGADPSRWSIPPVTASMITRLERDIDACEAELEPLRQFILPGGSHAGALLHLARTVARRAERACVALAPDDPVAPEILAYLNRLSDLCFVLARFVNRRAGIAEAHPTFGNSE